MRDSPPLPPPNRLASGDDAGRTTVWDVTAAEPIAYLADAHLAATGRRAPGGGGTAVRALAFGGPTPDDTLLILAAPGLLAAWDTRTGGVTWRRAFDADLGLASVSVAKSDARRVVLAGPSTGHVVLLTLASFKGDGDSGVTASSFRVGGGGGAGGGRAAPAPTLLAASHTPCGCVALAVGREITLYDPDTGALAPAGVAPRSVAPLTGVLLTTRVVGGDTVASSSPSSFTDTLLAAHADGAVSAWRRTPGTPAYACIGSTPLAPRGARVVAIAATLRGATAGGDDDCWEGEEEERALTFTDAFLILAATDDGAVTRWAAPVAAATGGASFRPTPSSVLHTPAARVTSVAACPFVASSHDPMLALGTAGGRVHIADVARGGAPSRGGALAITLGASLAVHAAPVRGVRWLGAGPRFVSFAGGETGVFSADGGDGDAPSTPAAAASSSFSPSSSSADVALIDARSRSITRLPPPRPRPPLLDVAASTSGRHLVLLGRGGASEVWTVGSGAPVCARVLDLPFAAAAWLAGPGLQQRPDRRAEDAGLPRRRKSAWSRSPDARARAARSTLDDAIDAACPPADGQATSVTTTTPPPDLPEDRLAFALSDGRVGVLTVRGDRVADARPRRPSWGLLGADAAPTAIADGCSSTSTRVLLGDAAGGVHAWDIESGRVLSARGAGAAVGRLLPCAAADAEGSLDAAVLAADGVGVWRATSGGVAAASPTPAAVAAAVGPVVDAAWVSLAGGGHHSLLLTATSDGALAALAPSAGRDVRACVAPGTLSRAPRPLGTALLLPPAWRELARAVVVASAAAPSPSLHAAAAALPPAATTAWREGAASRAVSEAAAAVAYVAGREEGGVAGGGAPVSSADPPFLAVRPAADGAPPPPHMASLADAVSLLASVRGGSNGSLLHAAETAALHRARGSRALTAAVAAAVAGDAAEAAFWDALPAAVKVASGDDAAAAACAVPPLFSPASAVAAARDAADARSATPRPRDAPPLSPAATELDVLDAIALGDLPAAVGLLLGAGGVGAPPAARYRDALAALALAAASGDGGSPSSPPPPLLAQVANVAAATFAAAGDGLLPVALHTARGAPAAAAASLADAGRWRQALALACTALPAGKDRAAVLERWAAALAACGAAGGATAWTARAVLVAAGSGSAEDGLEGDGVGVLRAEQGGGGGGGGGESEGEWVARVVAAL